MVIILQLQQIQHSHVWGWQQLARKSKMQKSKNARGTQLHAANISQVPHSIA